MINRQIVQLKPNIFVVCVEDEYDLALLFCRAQEYYESPNDDFRGKHFSIWDYMKWYTQNNLLGFTYSSDWSGFNIPFDVVLSCYSNKVQESPYDVEMLKIIQEISSEKSEGKAYLIGVSSFDGQTLKHELCHALFNIDKSYHQKAIECLDKIAGEDKIKFCMNLQEMGYTDEVFEDEIQAYLMFGHSYSRFNHGVKNVQQYHEMLTENLHTYCIGFEL